MFDVKQTIFVAFFAIIAFLLSNHVFEGSLSSVHSLKKELQSNDHDLSDWKIGEKAPFKYRILFKSIVQKSYQLMGKRGEGQFYRIYYFFSLFLYIALFYLFGYLIKLQDLSDKTMYFGVILLTISPPILFAYTLPVHTREDILAYCILLGGLICMKKGWNTVLIFIMIAGVFTRETLMVLPLYFILKRRGSGRAIVYFLLCALIVIGIRISMGMDAYNPFEGFLWNLSNPLITVGFAFLSFHVLWVLYLYSQKLNYRDQLSESLIVIVIVITTILFGRSNEIRLFFLAFPWLIISALQMVEQQKKVILEQVFRRRVLLLVLILLAIPAMVFANMLFLDASFPNRYGIPMQLWLNAGLVYLLVSTMGIVCFYNIKFAR